MDTTRYLDLDCVELRNQRLSLLVTQSIGPRLISLRLGDGDNLFAELPDITIDRPGKAAFHFYGGHRLWHAPEVPERTYLPDENPVDIEPLPDGLRLVQPIEAETGLKKSIDIRLPGDEPVVIIDHHLTNYGLWTVECAPWAITQFRPGGVAILPQTTALADPSGVLPNRGLVLWPYTDINDPRIHWGNQYILIEATDRTDPLKIGFPNPVGWLAYHIEDTLFVKYASYSPAAKYFDWDSSSQCYCRWDFLELETLGPRAHIAPDESVTHREVWRIFGNVGFTASESAAHALAQKLELGAYALGSKT